VFMKMEINLIKTAVRLFRAAHIYKTTYLNRDYKLRFTSLSYCYCLLWTNIFYFL